MGKMGKIVITVVVLLLVGAACLVAQAFTSVTP